MGKDTREAFGTYNDMGDLLDQLISRIQQQTSCCLYERSVYISIDIIDHFPLGYDGPNR